MIACIQTVKYQLALHSKELVKQSMLLRPEHHRHEKLHPKTKEKYIRMTQPLQPLSYKLHPMFQEINLELPHYKPLTPLEKLPFGIQRTNSGNLPVYVEYRNNHNVKRTVIRRISGDVNLLAEEIKKVVSNAEVRVKVGRLEIPGVHKESILMLLLRLGL